MSLIRLSTEVQAEYNSWIEALERAGCTVKVRGWVGWSVSSLHCDSQAFGGRGGSACDVREAANQHSDRHGEHAAASCQLVHPPSHCCTHFTPLALPLLQSLEEASQETPTHSQQTGASPSASQLSDSDASYRGKPRRDAGQEVDSGGPPTSTPPPQLLRQPSTNQGYTSDQSGGCLGGWGGREAASGGAGAAAMLCGWAACIACAAALGR